MLQTQIECHRQYAFNKVSTSNKANPALSRLSFNCWSGLGLELFVNCYNVAASANESSGTKKIVIEIVALVVAVVGVSAIVAIICYCATSG